MYCMGCMRTIRQNEEVCPNCGRRHKQNDQPSYALPLGSSLHDGRFLVGKVIGQGGFAITYIGLDTVLNLRVAIKEYYPARIASRESGTVSVYCHDMTKEAWNRGRESFVSEARNMAAINQIPSVVPVKDVFFQNSTAYIVMDYVEGETLKSRLTKTGLMKWDECKKTLFPIITALGKVHERGLFHRDVSPDNIMIDNNGAPWLLDLGAAKELDPEGMGVRQDMSEVSQTTHLVIKKGFSPPEQYTEAGKIGPWTDVYAMCATIIYCMTGKVIPDAMTRLNEDTLELSTDIPNHVAKALKHGLELRPNDRTQSMDQLASELDAASPVTRPRPRWMKIAVAAGACAVAGLAIFLVARGNSKNNSLKYTAYSNYVEITDYTGKDAVVEIPAMIEEKAVTVIADGAFDNLSSLKEIVIPEGVTSIGDEAFFECTSLKIVNLPDSLTEIGTSAFEGCASLKTVSFPDNLTSIGSRAFSSCSSLEEITIPESVQYIGDAAFSGCGELESAYLSSANVSDSMLKDCVSLTDMTIPFGVTNIGDAAFQGCTSLASVTIPDTVTRIGKAAFEGCANLSTVILPMALEEIGSRAFSDCDKLSSVVIPVMTSVGGDAFDATTTLTSWLPWAENLMTADVCEKYNDDAGEFEVFETGLKRNQINSVTFLPTLDRASAEGAEGWKDISERSDESVLLWWERYGGGAAEIYDLYIAAEGGVSAPENCYGLFSGYQNVKNIYFNDAFHTENVTNMKNMFYGCVNLVDVDVSGFDTQNVTDMRSLFSNCEKLTGLDLRGFDTSNVTDMGFMFSCCYALKSLDLGDFNTSNVTDMHAMFQICEKLTDLDVGGFDTANVTDMGFMFSRCGALKSLDVSKFDTSQVTDMGYMFNGCANVEVLDVSRFKTSKVTGMNSMFSNCGKVTELKVGGFDTSRVTNMGFMFDRCSSLTELDLSGFNTGRVTTMTTMFQSCTGLSELDLSNFNTERVTEMQYMFNLCSSLETIDISSFNTSAVIDFRQMFYKCGALTDVIFGAQFVIPDDADTTNMYVGSGLE